TLTCWAGPDDEAEIDAFLDRRPENVMALEKTKQKVQETVATWPHPLDFILGKKQGGGSWLYRKISPQPLIPPQARIQSGGRWCGAGSRLAPGRAVNKIPKASKDRSRQRGFSFTAWPILRPSSAWRLP